MSKNKLSYSDLNDELEEIIRELQSNGSDLDKNLIQYKRGIEIINELTNYLKDAKLSIKKIDSINK